MNGLMKYPVAESTGRATEGIDNIIASNRADYEASLPQPRPEATIGPTPWMETDEGQQTLMDVAMGSAFPGAAIGRISKASITGGQLTSKAMKNLLKKAKPKIGSPEHQLDSIDRQLQILRSMRPDKQNTALWSKLKKAKAKLLKDDTMDISPGSSHDRLNQIGWDNKLNAARLRTMKALDKHGLPNQPHHFNPKSDVVHPANYLLDQARKLTRN